MRDYTRRSATLAPEAAVELLNDYFDCLVPPIEAEGGEVLKYMGDGLLAIFREPEDDSGRAAQSALTAAVEPSRASKRRTARAVSGPITAGIALHHGEAAYGNVGSGARLDFTVIGPDVNLASRIAQLNKTIDEPLLMSKPFVDHLRGALSRWEPIRSMVWRSRCQFTGLAARKSRFPLAWTSALFVLCGFTATGATSPEKP